MNKNRDICKNTVGWGQSQWDDHLELTETPIPSQIVILQNISISSTFYAFSTKHYTRSVFVTIYNLKGLSVE